MGTNITINFENVEEIAPQLLRLMEGAKINTIMASRKMVDIISDALGLNLNHKKLKVRGIDLLNLYDTKELKIYKAAYLPSNFFMLIKTDVEGNQIQYDFKEYITK
jgi:hypothetical protein